jgi:TRAP-type uncharacterized transport system substrate-binding protein
MADTIRVSSVDGAGNWWRSLTWAAEALKNGGLQVEMTRYGIGASEPLLRVAARESDLACTLSVAAAQAAKGLGLHKNGEATSIRGLAHLIRPNQHYFNMIRTDVGIRSLAEIAAKKPKLDMSIGEKEYVSGQIPEAYMRHYGVELFRDIEAWGGSFQTSHPNTIPLIAQGKSNSLMREDTAAGPAGVAAQLFPFVLLPLDEDIADLIEREYCAPKVTIPAGTIHGQKEPCLTVTNPGFELIVNKDLPDDVVYRMAKALDQSSVEAFAAQDVFYSVRHAPKSTATLHPGAARYYREQGVLK